MGRSPIRILLIENGEADYLHTRKILSAVENQPYDVQWANSWAAGIEAVERHKHDVCLINFRICGRNGLEFLGDSRDRGCFAPIIFLGAVGDLEVDSETIGFGAADFLVRDKMTPEVLGRSIRYSIAQAQTTNELQRQRDESMASELRFRSIFHSVADAIILADETAKIVGWNKGAEQIFGYCEEEILGSHLPVLIPGSYRSAHLAGFERFLVTGRAQVIGKTRELEGLRKNGSTFPLELSLASWRSGTGTMFTGVVRDITERKQTEMLRREKEAAEEANRAKGRFVAIMSHELRTPLHAIIGFANLMLGDKSEEQRPQNRDFLQRILLNAKDQLRLINGVLDLSKIEAGKMELEPDDFAVETLLTDVINQMDGERRNPQVDLILRHPQVTAQIRADAARLKQVLTNLVDNALKFTLRGTVTIEVEVDPVDQRPIRINVSDTGIGIPPENIEQIFEPFHQLEMLGRKLEGSGLGMSICRSLCHLMGYRLEVHSCPGSGSTFSIILETEAHQLLRSA